MLKNYCFPIQIFIIMEKLNVNMWTKNNNSYNVFFLFIDKKWLLCINQIIRNELFMSNSSLIEVSNINSNKFIATHFLNSSNIIYYFYYILKLKIKLLILASSCVVKKDQSFQSIDGIFKNSNWLEREVSEMYNLSFYSKLDRRNLLLEYSKIEPVLLRDFHVEGLNDVYFSFFENQIIINKNISVEL